MTAFLAMLQALLLVAWPPLVDEARYPDLRALPPSDLLPSVELVDGAPHHVLRFTASIWNAGDGPLEVRGAPADGSTQVYQRIPAGASGVLEVPAGRFSLHPTHDHWHFEQFAAYELWTRDGYQRWLASGRTQGEPVFSGSKTTGGEGFCLRDSAPMPGATAGPARPVYRVCDRAVQGISVGWQDTYTYVLPEQWIDLGRAPLPDGSYVLRVIADPLNRLHESPDGAEPERESPAANEATSAFTVRNGCPMAGSRPLLPPGFTCQG